MQPQKCPITPEKLVTAHAHTQTRRGGMELGEVPSPEPAAVTVSFNDVSQPGSRHTFVPSLG